MACCTCEISSVNGRSTPNELHPGVARLGIGEGLQSRCRRLGKSTVQSGHSCGGQAGSSKENVLKYKELDSEVARPKSPFKAKVVFCQIRSRGNKATRIAARPIKESSKPRVDDRYGKIFKLRDVTGRQSGKVTEHDMRSIKYNIRLLNSGF